MLDPLYSLLGFAVGFLIGLTGVGGGSIMTPALLLLGLSPLEAVGTDLLYATITRLVGTLVYRVRAEIRVDIVIRLIIGSIPAIVLGGVILRVAPLTLIQKAVTLLLGTTLVLTSVLSLLDRELPIPLQPRKKHAILAGFIVGLLVQFTSIGAGVIVGFALLHIARLDPRSVVGTTLLFGLVLGSMSLANYAIAGYVNYSVASALVVGTLPGVILGSIASSRANPRKLKKAINVILVVIGLVILLGPAVEL